MDFALKTAYTFVMLLAILKIPGDIFMLLSWSALSLSLSLSGSNWVHLIDVINDSVMSSYFYSHSNCDGHLLQCLVSLSSWSSWQLNLENLIDEAITTPPNLFGMQCHHYHTCSRWNPLWWTPPFVFSSSTTHTNKLDAGHNWIVENISHIYAGEVTLRFVWQPELLICNETILHIWRPMVSPGDGTYSAMDNHPGYPVKGQTSGAPSESVARAESAQRWHLSTRW